MGDLTLGSPAIGEGKVFSHDHIATAGHRDFMAVQAENGAVCRLPSGSYLHVCREVIVVRGGGQRVGGGPRLKGHVIAVACALSITADGVFMGDGDLLHRHDLVGVAHGGIAVSGDKLRFAREVAVTRVQQGGDGSAILQTMHGACAAGEAAAGEKGVLGGKAVGAADGGNGSSVGNT